MASSPSDFRGLDVPSALWAPVRWVGIHALAFVGLLLAAWIVDWVFVFKVWPDGVPRLEGILAEEIVRLGRSDCWCGDLQALGVSTANALYGVVFGMTGLHGMVSQVAVTAPLSIPDAIVRQFLAVNALQLRAVVVGTQLFGVRVAALAAVLPLLGLAYTVGIVDGLVQRALRRVGGGKESAGVFHRRKYQQLVIVIGAVVGVIVVPVSLISESFWLGVTLCLTWLVRMQCGFLRKRR